MVRLLEDTFSRGLETVRMLVSHSGFTAALGEEIRKNFGQPNSGVDRAISALNREFFPTMEVPAEATEPVLLWRPLHATAIEVNLDAPVNLPFGGAKIEWTTPGQTGWVKVENKDGKLYVADREVTLYLTASQKSGSTKGHNVRKSLKDKAVLHPNILDALFENQRLIPESWKQNEHGETLFIFFWAQGFRNSDGNLSVRDLYWRDGQWIRRYGWLDHGWDRRRPAALQASP